MTEDPIIAEAVRLAYAEKKYETGGEQAVAVARHALRLAKEPEQDPAPSAEAVAWARFVKRGNSLTMGSVNHQAAAAYILKMAGEAA